MADFHGSAVMIALLGPTLLPYIAINLLLFLKRTWWDPRRTAKAMEAQGIRGPPYRFFHGTSAEASRLISDSMANPMYFSHHILPKVQPHFHSWTKLYGRNVLTWIGPTPKLVVGDPELVKEIMTDREGCFPKYEPPEFMRKLLGDGLVTARGQKWARHRRIATHAFRAESLKGMIPKIVAAVEGLMKKWTEFEGKEIDLFKEFSVLTSEIISKTAFGSSYIEGRDIFTKVDELTAIAARNFGTIRLPFFRKILPNRDETESDKIEQDIRGSILKIIRSRELRKENGEADGYGDDLLGLLMTAHHHDSITVDDIVDECKTFYFSGQETTTMMLSWTSLLLATSPDWQEKLRMEVTELLGDRSPTSEDSSTIARLKKMTMVMNESLRLYPPVLNILRTVARDARLGNLLLPQGMQIQISPLVIHHDAAAWGDEAHLFKPERFAGGVADATAAVSGGAAFLPFGVGPRVCVGQGLAMLEAKVALAMILQRHSFRLSPAYVHWPVSRLTCRPHLGIQAVLRKL